MSKAVKKVPIMSEAAERFMATEGMVQWLNCVLLQAARIAAATQGQKAAMFDPSRRRAAVLAFHSECHFFAIAAYKVIEHRKWAADLGLFSEVDFTGLDGFSEQDIRDLRNMREHQVDYFRGLGVAKDRWVAETPEYRADASTYSLGKIGGRLDWAAFAKAVETIVPHALASPSPPLTSDIASAG
jgi:hypothetical protein